jgi:hypothetical protein
MHRVAICVDAGYLFAQGSVALAGIKQSRSLLVLDAEKVLEHLRLVAAAKAPGCSILRIYWYDGSLASKPTIEQAQLAHLDDVKVRLGFINSAGQQKGVDSLIVTDLIELARLGAICDAVLMSGDEDVRVGVQIAQNYGVRIHLLGIEPARGSQSKALLQEADTTTEWSKDTIAKFLAVRSVPAASVTTTAAITAASSKAPTVQAAASEPTDVDRSAELDSAANEFAQTLVQGDILSLMAHWTESKGIPPEFDGKLLARSRAVIGQDLDFGQKRYVRTKFREIVEIMSKK